MDADTRCMSCPAVAEYGLTWWWSKDGALELTDHLCTDCLESAVRAGKYVNNPYAINKLEK